MFKKAIHLFLRDLKVNTRNFLTLYLLLMPILFALLINLFTPSINDTTINIALIKEENPAMARYLKDFTEVILVKDLAALEERVRRRDTVFAFVPSNNDYKILIQGNEPTHLINYAKFILTFYLEDVQIEDSTTVLHSFNRSAPPLKKLLVIIALLFSSILGGMLIGINIIEEKSDHTLHAIHLTPISRIAYLIGKSFIGAFVPLYGSIVILLICGFASINWLQMFLMIVLSTLTSILIGLISGIQNDTVMDAAGSVKILFLPLAGSIAVAELVSSKWQWLIYWSSFYWTYKGLNSILAYTAQWSTILLYAGAILIISLIIYFILMPRIRAGLE